MSTVFPVRFAWYLLAAAAGLLLYLVAPILTPFMQRMPEYLGELVALPASAALLVALRNLRAHYVDSDLYKS